MRKVKNLQLQTEVDAQNPVFRRGAFIVFLLCALYFSFHWIAHRDGVRMRDFLAPYTGSRCLWAACNPYNLTQIQHEFARSGGLEQDHPIWAFEPPVYPPSTLVALLPLSFLHYHAARVVWYGLTALLFFCALLAVVSFVRPQHQPWALLVAAAFYWSEPTGMLFNIGQPSGVSVSLAVLSVWFLFRREFPLIAPLCLGIALALKPQLVGVFFLYFLVAPRFRRFALQAGALGLAFLLVGITSLALNPSAKHWLREYKTQITQSQQHGAVNDPAPDSGYAPQFTNAETAFALFDNEPKRYNEFAQALAALLLCAWLVLLLRSTIHSVFAALSAIAAVGLLPIYHREYDLVLLMVSFPVLIELAAHRSRLAWPAIACTAALFGPSRYHHFWNKLNVSPQIVALVPMQPLRALIFTRWQPVVLCALACVYLLVMSMQTDRNLGSIDLLLSRD